MSRNNYHAGNGVGDPEYIMSKEAPVLVTGAAGFIGARVVGNLLERGFKWIRCSGRAASDSEELKNFIRQFENRAKIEIVEGDLLSREHCAEAVRDVAVIYHLAAGRGVKSFSDAFLNSVVTTRNLLEAAHKGTKPRRFVSVSSFSVYAVGAKQPGRPLDETCPMEKQPHRRGDAYCFAKVKQDELVEEYCRKLNIPHVIVRPGVVYGPGNTAIHGRVGIDTFGFFIHLGGSNHIPLTYVDNCAEAIVLAGLKPGVDGEVFNIVDDDLPSSRYFLGEYKKNVRQFRSVYLPHAGSYLFCWLWESYSNWSQGQLPPTFNRAAWRSYWKQTEYSNQKLKLRLGWSPRVPPSEALQRYFEGCRKKLKHA